MLFLHVCICLASLLCIDVLFIEFGVLDDLLDHAHDGAGAGVVLHLIVH